MKGKFIIKNGVVLTLSTFIGMAVGNKVARGKTDSEINQFREKADRYSVLFHLMGQWVKVRQGGKSLVSYFKREGYSKIAIFGMGYAGDILLAELKGSDIQVIYGIDRRADSLYADVKIVTLDEILEEVDAVVVTAVTSFEEIKENLSKKINCPIVSLEEILCEV